MFSFLERPLRWKSQENFFSWTTFYPTQCEKILNCCCSKSLLLSLSYKYTFVIVNTFYIPEPRLWFIHEKMSGRNDPETSIGNTDNIHKFFVLSPWSRNLEGCAHHRAAQVYSWQSVGQARVDEERELLLSLSSNKDSSSRSNYRKSDYKCWGGLKYLR